MTVSDVVILPVSDSIINKTTVNTIKKYGHTSTDRMYGRTPVELLDNIFMGDFAKNALLEYLKNNSQKHIVDYDEIRKDDFKNADPGWDFIVGEKQVKVEVKSSIPTKSENKEAIINRRDIKITASHDKGATWLEPSALESDIHVQIYFYAKPYRRGVDQFDILRDHIVKDNKLLCQTINCNKYSKPLFFGWNTRKNIIKYKENLKPNTWSFDKTSRIYWRCPIREAYTLPQLVDFINTN